MLHRMAYLVRHKTESLDTYGNPNLCCRQCQQTAMVTRQQHCPVALAGSLSLLQRSLTALPNRLCRRLWPLPWTSCLTSGCGGFCRRCLHMRASVACSWRWCRECCKAPPRWLYCPQVGCCAVSTSCIKLVLVVLHRSNAVGHLDAVACSPISQRKNQRSVCQLCSS